MAKWQPAPIVGGCYLDDSRPFSVQDAQNLLPQAAETEGTRSRMILRPVPGLQEFAYYANATRDRGGYEAEGKLFCVKGERLLQVNANGSLTSRGTIPGRGRCSFAHNGVNELKIVTGSSGYIYDWSTETLTQITDTSYPGEFITDYIANLFIGIEPGHRYFLNSAISDGLSYNALETYQGEAQPDRMVSLATANGSVVVFSDRSTEFFAYTGTVNALFERIPGTTKDRGCAATHAVTKLDEALYFIGDDGNGYELRGYQMRRITTHAIEQAWADCTLSKAFSFGYEDRGHKIWYVTFPDGHTWGYDIAASAAMGKPVWHRRKSQGMDRWRLSWLQKWNGRWYGGEYNSGRIFRLDWDYHLEGSDRIHWKRTSGVLHNAQNRVSLHAFEAVIDAAGEATTASGVFPLRLLDLEGNVPDGSTGTVIDYTYTVIGGQGPYTLAVTSGTLPTGTTMDSSGNVTGTYTTGGTFTWTVTVTDANGDTAALEDTAVVTAELYLTGDPPGGTYGVAYSYTGLTAHEGTAPYVLWEIVEGALPDGLAIDAGDGEISGTPTDADTFPFTVQVTDTAGGTAQLECEIEIASVTSYFNLHSITNAGTTPANGFVISGLNPSDTLELSLISSTYTAWSPWVSDSTPAAGGLPWRTAFRVTDDAAATTSHSGAAYATAAAALTGGQAGNPYTFTGSTEYTIWIYDTPVSGNRGGLSFSYEIT